MRRRPVFPPRTLALWPVGLLPCFASMDGEEELVRSGRVSVASPSFARRSTGRLRCVPVVRVRASLCWMHIRKEGGRSQRRSIRPHVDTWWTPAAPPLLPVLSQASVHTSNKERGRWLTVTAPLLFLVLLARSSSSLDPCLPPHSILYCLDPVHGAGSIWHASPLDLEDRRVRDFFVCVKTGVPPSSACPPHQQSDVFWGCCRSLGAVAMLQRAKIRRHCSN